MGDALEQSTDIAIDEPIYALCDIIEQSQRVAKEVNRPKDLCCLTFQLLRVVDLDQLMKEGTCLKLMVMFKRI